MKLDKSKMSKVVSEYYVPPIDIGNEWNAELRFRNYIQKKYGIDFKDDYESFWKWTVDNYGEFWLSVAEFCKVDLGKENFCKEDIVEENVKINEIPKWFKGSMLNYTENVLKNADDNKIAFIETFDGESFEYFSYGQLKKDIKILGNAMKDVGLKCGDAVATYMPNSYRTACIMLAAASLGCTFASCSTEFGEKAVVDRLSQVKPKLIFGQEKVIFKQKIHDNAFNFEKICKQLSKYLLKAVVVPLKNNSTDCSLIGNNFISFNDFINEYKNINMDEEIVYKKVPFNHPMYTMFSSGTTGLPKAMVHTVGGTLLKHVEEHIIQTDMSDKDVIMFYTTCGWMMWNWLMTALYTKATIVVFDESPIYPDKEILIKILARTKATIFGCGAKMYDTYNSMGIKFNDKYDLSNLRLVLSTGSPLKASSFEFINSSLKKNIVIGSICGGTDIIGCFMGATLNRPVIPGECQHLYLGMNCQTWNYKGESVKDEQGELVCVTPFVSQPSHFLNDEDGKKYYKSYFEKNLGVWTHGDYCEINSKTNGVIVYGRSDATLNRFGVRIGTAEIYNVVESYDTVIDSLVVGIRDQEDEDNEIIILFLKLTDHTIFDQIVSKIKYDLRVNMSPRHVPNVFKTINDIPYTHSGKKMELIVKQILNGEVIKNIGAVRNPECLSEYKMLFKKQCTA
uniref:Acetoacetyl-CoA synthetase n=1 Tax=Strongyloides stercoralis TaxID=6248 RepID=A0A0K0EAU5_STRER